MTAPICACCQDTGVWFDAPCLCEAGAVRRKALNRSALNGYAPPHCNGMDLAQRIEAIRDHHPHDLAKHACRGCDQPLLPGQPCGAYCKRCNEERRSVKPTPALTPLDRWVFGTLIAGALTLILLILKSIFFGG